MRVITSMAQTKINIILFICTIIVINKLLYRLANGDDNSITYPVFPSFVFCISLFVRTTVERMCFCLELIINYYSVLTFK